MSVFQFKKFSVSQENCPMKINTDGVLLGALADIDNKKRICDIGTGTGVIALMLAQRNTIAVIDAVEINEDAFFTAKTNFLNSDFKDRLNCFHYSFQDFFLEESEIKYDLILSNPPFFINSLKSPEGKTNLAKHTERFFFEELMKLSSNKLTEDGAFQLIVPLQISSILEEISSIYGLFLVECIAIKSFIDKPSFRHILKFKKEQESFRNREMVIYEGDKKYTRAYQAALKEFFTIF